MCIIVFLKFFKGVDINSPENLRGVPGPRRANKNLPNVHNLITQEWEQFRKRLTEPTREQILQFRNYIDRKYGTNFWEAKTNVEDLR